MQDHAATFGADRRGLYQAAVLEAAGKNPNSVTLEGAQIDSAVCRGLHRQTDSFQATSGHIHALPGSQNGGAVGRLNDSGLCHFHIGGNKDHIAIARNDVALHLHIATCFSCVSSKALATCQRI